MLSGHEQNICLNLLISLSQNDTQTQYLGQTKIDTTKLKGLKMI